MRGYAPFRVLLGVLALSGLACILSGLGPLTAIPPPVGLAEVPTPIFVLTPSPLPPEWSYYACRDCGCDMITAISNVRVADFADRISHLASHSSIGDVISLTIIRGSYEMNVDITFQGCQRVR